MADKTTKKTSKSSSIFADIPVPASDSQVLEARIVELERQLADTQRDLDIKTDEIESTRQDVNDFREAIETIDAGFALFDHEDRLVFCNQQYYKTFPKLTSRGLLKPGVRFEQIVREGAERGFVKSAVGRVEEYIAERMEKHKNPGEPYEYYHDNGNCIRTEERRTPSGAYVGTRTNVTSFKEIERKLAELLDTQKAQLNAFADHAPVAFFIKDRQGKFQYSNRHFQTLFDLRSYDIVGETTKELISEDSANQLIIHDVIVWETGAASSEDFDVPTAGGVISRLSVRKFPIINDEGDMIALGGVIMDVSEIRNANDELVRARDLAEAANQAKSEFMAAMNHELRTPLTSSLGSLGLLKNLMMEQFSGEAQELLEVALRNNQALLRLVNELLDYEKVLSGTLVIETKAHDVVALTSNIVRDMQGYAQAQSVNFVIKESGQSLFAKIHEHRFEQILNNLLSNAAKFSDAESDVEVWVTRERDQVSVRVKDKGPGIPEAFQEMMFEQFTQADSSSTRKHRGTGLGLTISKALTESMGGTLGFETKSDVGTTFFINFPNISYVG